MKKLLLLASVAALLAAGCNSTTQTTYEASSTPPAATSVPATNSPVNAPSPTTTAPASTGTLAVINVSGSTNTFPYSITIHSDGSAEGVVEGSTSGQTLPAGSVNVNRLQAILNEVGDVSKIAIGSCAKSASFGTTTTIVYNGKTSGDLQCLKGASAAPQADQDLANFAANVQAEIKINTARHLISLPQ